MVSQMKREGLLIVVSGFSGAGKGTLMKKLLETYDNYALSISMTSRNPRPGEEDGKAYFFATREEFERKIAEDGFIEHAEYCGNYYGTPADYVKSQMAAGKDVILEIEIQGAMEVKKKYPNALLLFVCPPSAGELKNRLVGRGTETAEVIAQRMSRATEEAKGIEHYEYIVVNDTLDECVKEMHEIVQAAHNTQARNEAFIQQIREELKEFSKGD